MNTRDRSARSESGNEQNPSTDAVERNLKEVQAQIQCGKSPDYYAGLRTKVAELIDELSARNAEERPIETIERLKKLRAEIELQIKAAD